MTTSGGKVTEQSSIALKKKGGVKKPRKNPREHLTSSKLEKVNKIKMILRNFSA